MGFLRNYPIQGSCDVMKNSPIWFFSFSHLTAWKEVLQTLLIVFCSSLISAQSQHKRFFPLLHMHTATSPPSICSNYALGASSEFHLCQFFRLPYLCGFLHSPPDGLQLCSSQLVERLAGDERKLLRAKIRKPDANWGQKKTESFPLYNGFSKDFLKSRVFGTNVSTLPLGAWLSWTLSNSSHFSGKRRKLFWLSTS